MALCGWCLTGRCDQHRAGGAAWTCDCPMIHSATGGMTPLSPCRPMWTFRCPSMRHRAMFETQDEAVLAEIHHRCKEDDVTLVEQAWAQLDAQVDEIMTLAPQVEAEKDIYGAGLDYGAGQRRAALDVAKARARGKAEILALFMAPHFTTADEISQEAGNRYQARQTGNTTYTTKGLGSRRTEI